MPIVTDPLSLFFIGCFLFGVIYLLVALLLGGWGHGHVAGHDAGHGLFHAGNIGHASGHLGHTAHTGHALTPGGDKGVQIERGEAARTGGGQFSFLSMFSPLSIALFLLVFGFLGYVLKNLFPLILPLTFSIAIVGGLVIAAMILWLMSRIFGAGEANTVQDISDRVGLVGKVSMTIRDNSLGEILYISPGGMRKSIPARSTDGRRIERDQEVVVVNYQNGIAEVDTWEHFINQEDTEEPQLPEGTDLGQLRTLLDELNRSDTEYVTGKDTQKE